MESPPPQKHGEELFKLCKDEDSNIDQCIQYFDNLSNDEQEEALKYMDDKVLKISILQTLLQFKSETIPLSFVKKLVDVGGKDLVEHRNVRGSNALHYTTYYTTTNPSYLDITKYIIEKCGIDGFKTQDNNDITPIHRYCAHKSTSDGEILRYIIEEEGGIDAIKIQDKFGRNPIHLYCANSNTKGGILKNIIEKKGGVEVMKVQDTHGNTPIHNYWKNTEVTSSAVEMLKIFAQNCRTEIVSIENKDGYTPINLYYKQNHPSESFLEALHTTILEDINKDIVNLFDFKLTVEDTWACKQNLARDIYYLQMNQDQLLFPFVSKFSEEIRDTTKYSKKAVHMLTEIKHDKLGKTIFELVHVKIKDAMKERLNVETDRVAIMTTFPIALSL